MKAKSIIVPVLVGVLMAFAIMPMTAGMAYAESNDITVMNGDGTVASPYEITSHAELKAFAEIVNGKEGQAADPDACGKLMKDIICTDKKWTPINNVDYPAYTGHFDGNNKTITGLCNEGQEGVENSFNQGLFGTIGSGGLLENVGLKDGKIIGKTDVGGIAGFNDGGEIINCYNNGTVSGRDCVGGVAGFVSDKATITNCYNSGAVSGGSNSIGGVAGLNKNSIITNCYNSGAVSGGESSYYIGGVAGYNLDNGTISNCYNTGTVSGESIVGGLNGENDAKTTNCYNIGVVSGDHQLGGIAGILCGETTNCYYDITLSAIDGIGDINGGTVTNVNGLSTSQMTGNAAIGADSMNFQYGAGEVSPWLVKFNGIDAASGEYYEYYPHLKGFVYDSDPVAANWPAKPHVHMQDDQKTYFLPWERTDKLPDTAGSYYLTDDVKLSSMWNVPGTVNLCLNDHSITYTGNRYSTVIVITAESAALDLYDCGDTTRYYYLEENNPRYSGMGHVVASEADDNYANAEDAQKGTFKGGFITGGRPVSSGGGVYIDGSGRSFTMNGGTIIGNTAGYGGGVGVLGSGSSFTMNGGTITGNIAIDGGGVNISSGGDLTMNGGNIISNKADGYSGGVFLGSDGIFRLSGAPVISGNKADKSGGAGDVCLNAGTKITITGKLQLPDGATTPQIGITIDGAAGVFTNGYSDKNPGEDPGKYFVSNDGSYAVYFDENEKEAQLAEPAVAPTITTQPEGLDLTYGYTTGNGLKVVASAAEGHTLSYQWYSCDAQGGEEAAIDTTKEPTAATAEYAIPEGKDVGDYHYFCRVTATRTYRNTATADSDVATVTVNKADLTIKAKDQIYEYDGKPHGEGDTAYEDAAQIAEKITVDGLQSSDEITSLIIDGAESEIGEYKDRITITGFMINGKPEAKDNYNITLLPGTLTIAKPQNSIVVPEPMTAKGKNALTIHWRKVSGAQGYDIFFSICGGDKKCKLTKTIKGNKTFSWTKTGLKTKTPYKAYVKGWTMKDGKKKYISKSPTLHLYTANGTDTFTVAKSIKVKKTKVSLKAGKTYKIKAKIIKRDKTKKLMPATHTKQLRYISTNKKIATVNKYGKIKAKAKGSCRIYVYAANGVSKAVKVTVR